VGQRSTPRRKKQRNTPAFDLKEELTRICGVDLTRIDSIDVMTAQTLVAEVGPDMSRWPTEDHFASWLTLTPNRDVSGGKVVRQEPRKSKNRVAGALRTAACTLLRSQSYLGAKYRALRTRLGAPKAIKAMARHLACLIYRMLKYGQAYVDQGTQYFEQKRAQRELSSLQRKAAALGYQLVQPASA
jgi:hypothetical protein